MKIDASTSFASLAAIDAALPAVAAPFIFCNGEENLIGFDALPAGVSDENIAWLADNSSVYRYDVYAALGMAFWRYTTLMRVRLLEALYDFNPFSVCPLGGLAHDENVESLLTVASFWPVAYMMHWGKFRAINCKCTTAEQRCGVATHRFTEIAVEVLERIRRTFPDRAAVVDKLPAKTVFY